MLPRVGIFCKRETALYRTAGRNSVSRRGDDTPFSLIDIRRLVNTASNEAAGKRQPEAYPLGYVEDFGELGRSANQYRRLVKTACAKAAGNVGTEAYPCGTSQRDT